MSVGRVVLSMSASALRFDLTQPMVKMGLEWFIVRIQPCRQHLPEAWIGRTRAVAWDSVFARITLNSEQGTIKLKGR